MGNRLWIKPAIPADWPGFEIRYRYKSTSYRIAVTKFPSSDGGGIEVVCDGRICQEGIIELVDDGDQHTVAVAVGVETLAPALSNR